MSTRSREGFRAGAPEAIPSVHPWRSPTLAKLPGRTEIVRHSQIHSRIVITSALGLGARNRLFRGAENQIPRCASDDKHYKMSLYCASLAAYQGSRAETLWLNASAQ